MIEPPAYGTLRVDYVGRIYFGVFGFWTSLFFAGLFGLYKYRKLSFIRLKNVPLVFAALVLLHIQLTFDLLAYPLNGVLPCAVEYWIMTLCLPLGIALFQAQNMQLFSTFYNQQHLLRRSTKHSAIRTSKDQQGNEKLWVTKKWEIWQNMCYLRRTYWLIALGVLFQFIIGIIIFFISRKFHPSFGVVSPTSTLWTCRAGWEWFPSTLWQALYTYLLGPLILYKIRHIRDTHNWKLQTTLAILFSLPALPLWLSTLATPNFYQSYSFWPPNLWFVPGLAAMEFVILFFPLWEVWETRKLKAKVAFHPGRSEACKYSMAALERALRDDIERLECFAAEKDFSGENIIFLKRVENWKDRWVLSLAAAMKQGQERIPEHIEQNLFDAAQQIFHDCISNDTSPFPVNIDERIYLELARMFGEAGQSLTRKTTRAARAMIAPWAEEEEHPSNDQHTAPTATTFYNSDSFSSDDERPPTPPRKNSIPTPSQSTLEAAAKAAALLWGRRVNKPLPRGFGKTVFDEAEGTVKQMVLENTWVRFVDCTDNIVGAEEAREEEEREKERRELEERKLGVKGKVRTWTEKWWA
ncbi:hypothetical protein BJ508DRAFT_210715 [Ascobolus immersus RN42]|uniref:RGS domain-containing protein n=1 Tax=Ascobolus immersus RN42 TaxID=1160509 RepID=A0A3N4IE66_ASCIM|nr:hypothetical protein BJ508DRAFT_210715 [Ascobolus immersus RN42]